MSLNFRESDVCCPMCLSEELIGELLEIDEYEGVSVYANVDIISELLKMLICTEVDDEGFELGMIDIDGQSCDYDGEYILTINYDRTIWIEPAFRKIDGEWELFDSESYVTFVDKNCDEKILARLIKNDENIVMFDFED
jgi:hypothetical protein